jgi:hypothetical protein
MEALAILLVFAVVLGLYLGARFGGGYRSARTPARELDHLHAYRGLLQEKVSRGRREQWDGVMMAQIASKLEEVERRIAELPPDE